jgi:hypothetical protein
MKREKRKTKKKKRRQKYTETLITMSSVSSKSSWRKVYNDIKKKLLMVTKVGRTCRPKMAGDSLTFDGKCDSL